MDMTHMNHMQMEHETGTSYLWLIIGAIMLLFSIAAYIWASRTQGKVLGHMKKKERADIQKKSVPPAGCSCIDGCVNCYAWSVLPAGCRGKI